MIAVLEREPEAGTSGWRLVPGCGPGWLLLLMEQGVGAREGWLMLLVLE